MASHRVKHRAALVVCLSVVVTVVAALYQARATVMNTQAAQESTPSHDSTPLALTTSVKRTRELVPLYTHPPEPTLFELQLQSGDNLSKIFAKLGIPRHDLYWLTRAGQEGRKLRKVYAGNVIRYARDDAGRLQQFEYIPDRRYTYRFQRNAENRFDATTEVAVETTRKAYIATTVHRGESPISAGFRAGLRNEQVVLNMTQVLEWDIDFWHDIRPGDSYRILYEQVLLDGEYADDGRIHAIEFINRGKPYQAFFFDNGNGATGYYQADGSANRKLWLRAPLEYQRISSNFNPRRLHPILKVVRPHNGIDYAAPTGTPVRATGDGVIATAGYRRNNGNYVIIEHPNGYETRYLHLSRIATGIAPGVEVKQSQVIGNVGATGLATGPHLHYEFLHHGRHINPKNIATPPAPALEGDLRDRFLAHVQTTKDEFDAYHTAWLEENVPAVATN